MYTGRPCAARSRLSRANASCGRYTSPRTSTSAGGSSPVIRQRDLADGAEVRRHVLPGLAVTSRRAPLEDAVPVHQRDGEAVDLRLSDVAGRLFDPGGLEQSPHALVPRRQRVRVARVGEREHRLGMAHLGEADTHVASDPLGRGVGRDERRLGRLDRPQLGQEGVVGLVVDRRVVGDVVGVIVPGDLRSQYRRPMRRRVAHEGARRIAYSSSTVAAMASAPARSARDATPQVTPIAAQPAARAASRSGTASPT